MNFILSTYSDIYSTAMMNDQKARHHVVAARTPSTIAKIARFLRRG